MNIVCYAYIQDKIFRGIWEKMHKKTPELGLELHRNCESFEARLKQPGRNIAAVMLYIAKKEVLPDLLALRPLLDELPIIILLKDQEPDILKFSHEVKPRMILYTFWKQGEICSALEHSILRYCGKERPDAEAIAVAGRSPSKARRSRIPLDLGI